MSAIAATAGISPQFQPERSRNMTACDRGRRKGGQLFQAHRFAAARFLPVAAALFAFLATVTASMAASSSGECDGAAGLSVLSSPVAPWKGAPLRVLFALEKPFDGELSLIAPDGSIAAKSHERHGGPPYFLYAEVASPAAGDWQARLVHHGESSECKTIQRQIAVQSHEPPRPGRDGEGIWPVRDSWNRGTENLYSAWIEKLFDAPLDAAPSWPALHEVLRDRSRNMLHNHLGLGEDPWAWSCGPTAPTCPTSCAPISRSRWACRSATRNARAAAAASLQSAGPCSAFKIPRSPVWLSRPAPAAAPRAAAGYIRQHA